MAIDVKNDVNLSVSLVSYWELEEASGTRVDSHAGNDLTDNNTVGQAVGIQGNAADFEKDNAESLSITKAAQTGLNYSTDFAYSLWLKPESQPTGGAGSGNAQYLLGRFATTSNQRAYALTYEDISSVKKLHTYVSSDGNSVGALALSQTLSNATMYHIVWQYDVSAGQVEIFINSVSIGTVSGGATSIFDGTSPFTVGEFGPGLTENLDSIVDEIGTWSKLLTQTEIDDLYNSGSGIPYEVPTVTKTVQSKARIQQAGKEADTQLKSRIQQSGNVQSLQSKGKIIGLLQDTIQAKANIMNFQTQSVKAKASIMNFQTKAVQTKAALKKAGLSYTIRAKARVNKTSATTIQMKARIRGKRVGVIGLRSTQQSYPKSLEDARFLN